jgi:hypothetical protein
MKTTIFNYPRQALWLAAIQGSISIAAGPAIAIACSM